MSANPFASAEAAEAPQEPAAAPDAAAAPEPVEAAADAAQPATPEATPADAPAEEPAEAPAIEPIDPEVFNGPPAADSFAPAGTGIQGSGQLNGADGAPDARIKWRVENEKILEKREAEEKKAAGKVKEEAQKWLKQFNDDRGKRITKTKKDNLAQESAAKNGPKGDTEWAKVNSMIDFTFKPPQETETERERFKALLFQAKDKNVPVKA